VSNESSVLTILEDPRKILAAWEIPLRDDTEQWEVGRRGVTEIKAYPEPAQYCNVPWIAVFLDGEVAFRIPAGSVCIQYALAP